MMMNSVFLSMLIFTFSVAASVDGDYQSFDNSRFNLSIKNDQYVLNRGHLSQRVENFVDLDLKYCLSFDLLDIAIPHELKVGTTYTCNGNPVNIYEVGTPSLLGCVSGLENENLYYIEVRRNLHDATGKYIQVRGGLISGLVYSQRAGVVSVFTEGRQYCRENSYSLDQ